MRCSKCGTNVGEGAAWGPCVPGGHLSMVCSECNVVPQSAPAARTRAVATPEILGRLKSSTVALSVVDLVKDPISRRVLVRAVAEGRVHIIDGDRVIAAG